MAIVVVGGHSRSVGKTSVVVGLIAALPEFHWTAMKVTQHGHGICSADGEPCECSIGTHEWAISEEQDRFGKSDSSRFLLAGASHSLWVRTQQGRLAEAMPAIRKHIEKAHNLIIESNSIVRFLRPNLYLTVLDPATADFKQSAREFLDLADAVILHDGQDVQSWKEVSLKPIANRPVFRIRPPRYVTPEIAEFVRRRLSNN